MSTCRVCDVQNRPAAGTGARRLDQLRGTRAYACQRLHVRSSIVGCASRALPHANTPTHTHTRTGLRTRTRTRSRTHHPATRLLRVPACACVCLRVPALCCALYCAACYIHGWSYRIDLPGHGGRPRRRHREPQEDMASSSNYLQTIPVASGSSALFSCVPHV